MPLDMSRFLDRFVSETREKLGLLDEALAALEGNPERAAPGFNDAVGELMRLVHSIKGSARMMGFIHINRLAHGLEDLLIAVRNRGRSTRREFDAIFRARDGIDRLLSLDPQKLKNGGSNPEWFEDITQLLLRLSRGEPVQPLPGETAVEWSPAPQEGLDTEVSQPADVHPDGTYLDPESSLPSIRLRDLRVRERRLAAPLSLDGRGPG